MKVGKKELQKRSFPNSYLNCNYQRDKGLMITLSLGEICEKVGMRHHLLFGLSADQEREKYDWFKRKIPFVLSRAMEEKGLGNHFFVSDPASKRKSGRDSLEI